MVCLPRKRIPYTCSCITRCSAGQCMSRALVDVLSSVASVLYGGQSPHLFCDNATKTMADKDYGSLSFISVSSEIYEFSK